MAGKSHPEPNPGVSVECPVARVSVHKRRGAVRLHRHVRRVAGIIVVGAWLCGCSADWYKQSADSQVNRILNDRTKTALGYTPQIEAATTVNPNPSKQAYAKIPLTPIPPREPPVLDLADPDLPFAPLGPQDLFGEDVSPGHRLLTEELARTPSLERLRLGPPATVPEGNVLDLFESIDFAVQHNRDYQTQMENLYLVTLELTFQQHLFEPRFFADTAVQYAGGQQDVNYRSALSVTNSVSVRQQLPYGGEVVAQALVDFVDAYQGDVQNAESADLVISGNIPLLRGAGIVNLEPLIQAERNLVYAVRSFEDFRRGFAVQVATQYFRLRALQQGIENRRFNYIVLLNLTEQTDALFEAGRINFLQVQRALQSQLQAENSLIDAEDAYAAALDNFKITLGMPVEEPVEVVPTDLDVDFPDLDVDAPALALQYRLDLQTARDQIEDAQRAVQVAKNGLLADLNLVAQGTIGSPEDSPAAEISGSTAQYEAGINLSWPLDRLRERNVYRASLISLERAQRGFVQTRDQIIADVRDSLRNIRSALAVLEIQQNGVALAQKRLDFSNELLIQGRASDNRDVVEAQNSLLQAQDGFDRARAEVQIQILQYLRDTGILRVDPSAGALGIALDRALPRKPFTPYAPGPIPARVGGG